mmetsp:Transcript_17877/g.41256  ORF Transcript_17877/g.41256 Transcript_17877/m.41256 type:complete len:80 (-) Transcript_17877:397-636(-)
MSDRTAANVAEVSAALSELRAQLDSQVCGLSDQMCAIRGEFQDCRTQLQSELQGWKADLDPSWQTPWSSASPTSITIQD